MVRFKTLLMKVHNMGFSKKFLLWVFNHLCDRRQVVQIDDKLSKKARVEFGVPQGSILSPVFFDLYVANLHKKLEWHGIKSFTIVINSSGYDTFTRMK